MRILLVDDEVEMTEALQHMLTLEGYGVDVATNGQAGETLAQTHSYDLLILDWMLPECSGVEICQNLRSRGDQTPVLFLTARDTVDDRVAGLDAGADDYLVKPFELRELLARVRALLRRPPTLEPTPPGDTLEFADLGLDIRNQLAHRGDRAVALSEKETQLLALLMRHPGEVLTHEQIADHLWGREAEQPTSNALAAQIRLLRRKIEPKGEPPLIHTVYGRGYRFGPTEA